MATEKESHHTFSRTVIGDIAEKSGFSTTTVSRVLNSHPDVSPATREKVLHFARKLGYFSSRQARTTTHLIGLTIPMFNNYFGAIVEGAIEALQERDAQFVIARTNNKYAQEVSQIRHFLRHDILGIMFILAQESAEELLELKKQGVPLVVTDPLLPLPSNIPVVTVENISASRDAVEHLLQLGHRRIGLVSGPGSWGSTIDRMTGYYATLAAHGIPIDTSLIRESNWMPSGGFEATRELLALPDPPTAIFAFNDDMALGVLHAAWAAGLKVPDDLSVVGFDDSLDSLPFMVPPLTTVSQPLKEIGRLSVDVLYRIIQQQPIEATHIKLSTRLIERGSTGPCRRT